MSTLHRTQIYLENEQMSRLKSEASKAHLAVSELIRRAVDLFLKRKVSDVDWDSDPLTKAVGKIKLSRRDASIRHDEILYGFKKD